MPIYRSIQNVSGPTISVPIPPEFVGKQVEVIVQSVENPDQPLPPELDPRIARYIMAKPPLTEEDRKVFAENPYPLRGTGGDYIDPFEPAVPSEDWEVYRDDPA